MDVEEKQRRLRIGLGGSFLIALLLLSASEDRFQKLINHQENPALIAKLEEFRKEGVERTVSKENYEIEKVIEDASSFLGTPASMGGISHKGIDCSGLVMMAHKSCGIELPHSAQEQARYGKLIVSIEKLQRGDLVFFHDSYSTSKFITHSGIYLGENKFIHTSSSKGVAISDIDDPYYWKKRFLFGTRFEN